jgi:hypothetical protein
MPIVAAPAFFLLVSALLGVGAVSWRRTRALRQGSIRQARDPPGCASFSSSKTTFLAALAGISAAVWGGAIGVWGDASAVDLRLLEAASLIGVGLFVAIAGAVARVTGFHLDHERLLVFFAGRPARSVAWSSLLALRPPASPFGGWRLTDARGTRSTLMPSDVFGHEEVLELIVVQAGMRFDGRTWKRTQVVADRSRLERGFSPRTE